jgi:hypothetical protein
VNEAMPSLFQFRPWDGPSGISPVSMEHADGPSEEQDIYAWDDEEGDWDLSGAHRRVR